jgi:glucose/arabinose dehydrogenase
MFAAAAAMMMAPPWPLAAQQTPAGPAPAAAPAATSKPASFGPPVAQGQPSWTQAMPETATAANLRPQVPPPIPTPADKLPLAKLKLPKGFHIAVFASGMPQARSLRVDAKGTVFVSTRTLDRIYAIVDRNGKREVKTLLTGLRWPNGIALHNGTLYIAELNRPG